ncbi:hypothetical protein CALVIDRAFT_535549 [Calocera viscosa TUFC12733]|uniref:Uncharacterized protein n=1 Tax=Calocera viscosa (strain TUFC12733) TaxID=1330018 RepID=A0A167NQF8_CALVF|nr:hypothetical protein CALVIDRAFT_535549 [Calocera viscosa TUFC12733]
MPPRSRAATPMRKPAEVPDEAPPTASMFDPDRQQTPRTPGPSSRILGLGQAAATSTPANYIPDSADNSFRSAILNASQLNITPQRPGIGAADQTGLQPSPTPSSASHGTVQERAPILPGNQRTPAKQRGIVIREDPGMVSCFDPKDEALYKLWVG